MASEHDRTAAKSDRLQLVLAVLLGLAALATAFAAYRGDLYSGDSVILLNQSVQSADESSQAFNAAETVFVQDVTLFTQFAIAANSGQEDVAKYIQDGLMRPQLGKQVDWWSDQPDSVATPFVERNPFYTAPRDNKRGGEVRKRSDQQFKRARVLDDTGDEFVLYTVLFAAALFMYGIASVATSRRVLLAGLGVGGVLFAIAALLMIVSAIDAPPLL